MEHEEELVTATIIRAKDKEVRKVYGIKKPRIPGTKVPKHIIEDERIIKTQKLLGDRYNWELPKTIWRIITSGAKIVALQMPEGLVIFATTLCDLIEEMTEAVTLVLADVTYGACCVDDFAAKALGVDLLVHYGHSCLIPLTSTTVKVLYVFVDIALDTPHLVETVKRCLPLASSPRLALVSTIQFAGGAQRAAADLRREGYEVSVPQSKPLSPGEVLGCTAPSVGCSASALALVYVGDGRFHLEAAMIANPRARAFRYDPYAALMTEEFYDHALMRENRKAAVEETRGAASFGLVLGTLGRQGSLRVLNDLAADFLRLKRHVVILLSEIFPQKLRLVRDVDAFVQIACPRLSIDWGACFDRPLLTPYELAVAFDRTEWPDSDNGKAYPMDYYAESSLGPWTPNHRPDTTTPPSSATPAPPSCCGKCAR